MLKEVQHDLSKICLNNVLVQLIAFSVRHLLLATRLIQDSGEISRHKIIIQRPGKAVKLPFKGFLVTLLIASFYH
jgi:hypothetical protein